MHWYCQKEAGICFPWQIVHVLPMRVDCITGVLEYEINRNVLMGRVNGAVLRIYGITHFYSMSLLPFRLFCKAPRFNSFIFFNYFLLYSLRAISDSIATVVDCRSTSVGNRCLALSSALCLALDEEWKYRAAMHPLLLNGWCTVAKGTLFLDATKTCRTS